MEKEIIFADLDGTLIDTLSGFTINHIKKAHTFRGWMN